MMNNEKLLEALGKVIEEMEEINTKKKEICKDKMKNVPVLTRKNLLEKHNFFVQINKIANNPMVNREAKLMFPMGLVVDSLMDSLAEDMTALVVILTQELGYPSQKVKGFLKYLFLDLEGQTDKMVDDTKYREMWKAITEQA